MSHQSHRGSASRDKRLFAASQLPKLCAAAADLCWLLDREYALRSALELVGNRHSLVTRQRLALSRYACSENDARHRQSHCLDFPDGGSLRGRELWIDGYNVLTLLESALGGGIVLLCRDGCCRDIAGIHRRYRHVNETIPALLLVGEVTAAWGVSGCRWWLDKPVSNSGRLKKIILDTARANGWNMEVEVVFSPDHALSHTDQVIATSDGIVLDRCQRWVNLARLTVQEHIPKTHLVDFSESADG